MFKRHEEGPVFGNVIESWNGKPLRECSCEELIGLAEHLTRKLVKCYATISRQDATMKKASEILTDPNND